MVPQRLFVLPAAAIAAVIALGAAQAQSAGAAFGTAAPSLSRVSVSEEVGAATWYGEDFDGRVTASGERFDMYGLTAAHPSLPMQSLVEVTDLENGRKIIVTVNDRRTPPAGGVIVLSKAAAASLGFAPGRGARVRVRCLQRQTQAGWRQAASE